MSLAYRVELVELERVRISGKNTREIVEDDSIVELAADIAQKGLLQPVGLRAEDGGGFRLLWGERRYRAHIRLGRKVIEARVYPENGLCDEAIMASENLHRQQHTLAEESAWVAALIEGQKMSVEDASRLLNRSRSWIQQRMMIPNLPEYLREPLLDGSIKLAHVEEIGRLEDEGAKQYIVSQVVQGRLSRMATRQLVEVYRSNPALGPAEAVGEAVRRGDIPVAPVMLECQHCARRRPVAEFMLVRVCADGCADESAPAGEVNGNEH